MSSQFASRAFTGVVANGSASSAAAVALASSSSSASLLGFAASGAAVAVLSSPSSSITTAPFASSFSIVEALLPVAQCLALRDPNNHKLYDVETQTYGSYFTPFQLFKRAGIHLAAQYTKAGTAFIEVGRNNGEKNRRKRRGGGGREREIYLRRTTHPPGRLQRGGGRFQELFHQVEKNTVREVKVKV